MVVYTLSNLANLCFTSGKFRSFIRDIEETTEQLVRASEQLAQSENDIAILKNAVNEMNVTNADQQVRIQQLEQINSIQAGKNP